jgi:hypothetical protein
MKKLKHIENFLSGDNDDLCKNVNFPLNGLDISKYVINKESIEAYNIKKEEYAEPDKSRFELLDELS